MARETTPLPGTRRLKVWDPWIRLVHWAIVLLIPLSWWSAETHRFDLHVLSGYTILTLLIFRIAWGFVGSQTARFRNFLASPLEAIRHLGHFRRRQAAVEIGHNAAGGWMVLVLLGLLLAQAVSGLFADDEIFTRGPLARAVDPATSALATSIHLRVFWGIVAAAVLHILAILLYRLVRKQNLVGPMITGALRLPVVYRGPQPRMGSNWLALALLAAAAGAVWALVSWGSAQGSASAFG
ncbi:MULTISPECIES: cytochrome b/b6 domain-containing protein [Roseomonadaceae]|uniref:Cytochrome b/b6 domain-containing protein n=1 Tax=Falsiroseomonas oleicola TaxID=2801474 RepID=A0ABS6H473_9PROT|nr:cytochrome b/b6 domain-containing protein [Roseomonas oleicola]MBU8543482.1 cytochrome b/b6 domain-containing protein [Roseomonas oleicola]